jgi:hypothetical protein
MKIDVRNSRIYLFDKKFRTRGVGCEMGLACPRRAAIDNEFTETTHFSFPNRVRGAGSGMSINTPIPLTAGRSPLPRELNSSNRISMSL